VAIFPLFLVPVALVDTVLLLAASLESIFVFSTSPSASGWMEQKSLFVLLRDVINEVVCDRELTVKLFETNSAVLQEQESVLTDGPL
jgi:uncharacterized membrane protein SirB2